MILETLCFQLSDIFMGLLCLWLLFSDSSSKVECFLHPCSADWGCELIFDGSMLEKMNVVYLPGYSNPVTENSRQSLESSQGSCGLGIHCPVATWWPKANSPGMTPAWATEAIRVEPFCLYGFKACYAFYPGSGQSSRSSRGTILGTHIDRDPEEMEFELT